MTAREDDTHLVIERVLSWRSATSSFVERRVFAIEEKSGKIGGMRVPHGEHALGEETRRMRESSGKVGPVYWQWT